MKRRQLASPLPRGWSQQVLASLTRSSGEGFVLWATKIALVAIVPVLVIVVTGCIFRGGVVTHEAWLPNWHLENYPYLQVFLGFFDILVGSPLVETAFMFVPIRVFRLLRISASWIPALSGVVWALLHARNGIALELVSFWPFYCFTAVLLDLERTSQTGAWLRVSFIHSIYNVLALASELALASLFE